MWNDIKLYFEIGYNHIVSPIAWDHVLFVIATCMLYIPNELKKTCWLITSFTIGHCIALILVAFKLFQMAVPIFEFLIPITILSTAIANILNANKPIAKNLWQQYVVALFFGMIHGVAFATDSFGLEGSEGLFGRVLGFNLGIEMAQVTVLFLYFLLLFVVILFIKSKKPYWDIILSLLIALYALYLAIINYKKI